LQACWTAGIVGGGVVGALSGLAVSVSQPAAGLAAIVADPTAKIGSRNAFLTMVMLAVLLPVGFVWLHPSRISRFFQ